MVKDLECVQRSKIDFESLDVDFKGQRDEFIWACFTQGNKSVFTYLYKTYANMLYNYGAKFIDDKHTLEDCLQRFFTDLYRTGSTFDLKYSCKHFFLKSFRVLLKQYLEEEAYDTKSEPKRIEFQLKLAHRENTPSKECKINERVVKERLEGMFSNLDSNQREAIFLFYYEQLDYAEIEDILGLASESSDVNGASGGIFDSIFRFCLEYQSLKGSLHRTK